MNSNLVALILSHDRAGDIPTIGSLERYGYTGDWYIVIDDPDDIDPYTEEYGEDKVIYFDKDDVAPKMDRGDNFNRRNSILYARYQSFQIARDLGYDYFIQLDDDYSNIQYRFDETFSYNPEVMRDFDDFLDSAVDFIEDSEIDTLALAQGGDFIGGSESQLAECVKSKRKVMNSFICKADNQFDFRGSINEDVNTYTRAQQLGKVFLTTNAASIEQESTQQAEGGLTDLYRSQGTYIKSFYTLLYSPSSVSLGLLHDRTEPRIHHKVNWRTSVPKIVPESLKNSN